MNAPPGEFRLRRQLVAVAVTLVLVVTGTPECVTQVSAEVLTDFDGVFVRQWGVVDSIGIPSVGSTAASRRPEGQLGVPFFTDVTALPSARRIGTTQYPPTLPSTSTDSFVLPGSVERSILRRWSGAKLVAALDDEEYPFSMAAITSLSSPRAYLSTTPRPATLYSNAFAPMGVTPYAITQNGYIHVGVATTSLPQLSNLPQPLTSPDQCPQGSSMGVVMSSEVATVNSSYSETYSTRSYLTSFLPLQSVALGGEFNTDGAAPTQQYSDATYAMNAVHLYVRVYMWSSLSDSERELFTKADSIFQKQNARVLQGGSEGYRDDYPSVATTGILDPSNRGVSALSAAEQARLCHIPYVFSHRVNDPRGSTAVFSGQALSSRLGAAPSESAIVVMIVQCSPFPLRIRFNVSVENSASGETVTRELLSLPDLFAAFLGLYALAGFVWLLYLLVNVCFFAKRFPTVVQILAFVIMGTAATCALAGLSWSSGRLYTDSVASITVSSGTVEILVDSPSVLLRTLCLALIFICRPLIASGYGTFRSRVSVRMRSILIVTTPVFAVCCLFAAACKGMGSTSAFGDDVEDNNGSSEGLCRATTVAYNLINVGSILVCWVLVYTSTDRARVLLHSRHDGLGSGSPQTATVLTPPSAQSGPTPRAGFEVENMRHGLGVEQEGAAGEGNTFGARCVSGALPPDYTDHFIRFSSLQVPFVVMIQFPIVSWVVDAAILSRRNTMITLIIQELEVMYFVVFCLLLIRHSPLIF